MTKAQTAALEATKAAAAKAAAESQATADAAHDTDVFAPLNCRSYAIAPLQKAVDELALDASPALRLLIDIVMSNRDQLAFIGGVVNKLSGKTPAASSNAGASKYK